MTITVTERFTKSFTGLLCANGLRKPFFLLDERLMCIKSSNDELLPEGMLLSEILKEEVSLPVNERHCSAAGVDGVPYSAELYRLSDEQPMYLCKLTQKYEVSELAEKADVTADFLPMYTAIDHGLSNLWGMAGEIEHGAEANVADRMRSTLYTMSAAEKNYFEYLSLMYTPLMPIRFDLRQFCDRLAVRCSSHLDGRRSVSVSPLSVDSAEVMTDKRRCTVAVVNLIQNALLYSPKDFMPEILVTTKRENGRCFAVVKIQNLIAQGNDDRMPDMLQRFSCGLLYARRYAELCSGSFEASRSDSVFTAELCLPLAEPDTSTVVHLESHNQVEYKTGVPDFIEIKMHEALERMRCS